jgi:hypothetical protein
LVGFDKGTSVIEITGTQMVPVQSSNTNKTSSNMTTSSFVGMNNAVGLRTTIAGPAHIRIFDLNSEQTSYACNQLPFCVDGSGGGSYVVSGHVVNDGGNTSNVIQLVLIITDNQTGAILYQTTFSSIPTILARNEEGAFSQQFDTETWNFRYSVRVLSS